MSATGLPRLFGPPPGPHAAATAPARVRTALRPYLLAARNGFRRGLQYRADHVLKVVGGVIFGVVFIAVWRSALRGPGGAATAAAMGVDPVWIAHYVAISQAMLWITTFLPMGLGIPAAVRTGQITADLMRPVSFFGLQMAREAGALGYSTLLRTLPLAAVFGLLVGLPRPGGPAGVAVAVAATLGGAWIALCLNYLVGISAFWTTETRAAHWLLYAVAINLGGADLPLRAFPAVLRAAAEWLPFAGLLSTPVLAWMGSVPPTALLASAAWALALGWLCARVTRAARRRVEVQGG